jgi:hypothetical protein
MTKDYVTNAAEVMKDMDDNMKEQVWAARFKKPLHEMLKANFGVDAKDGTWAEVMMNIKRLETSEGQFAEAKNKKAGEWSGGMLNTYNNARVRQMPDGSLVEETPGQVGGMQSQSYPQTPASPSTGVAPMGKGLPYPAPRSQAEQTANQNAITQQKSEREAVDSAFGKDMQLQNAIGKASDDFAVASKNYSTIKDAVGQINQLMKETKKDANGGMNISANIGIGSLLSKLVDPTTGVKQEELRNMLQGNAGLYDKFMNNIEKMKYGEMGMVCAT